MIQVKTTARNVTFVVNHANALPAAIDQAAAVGLKRGLEIAAGVSQRQFLQGPRPAHLGEVTQRLRQSITSAVETEGGRITGRLGTNVKYAAFHEFGFHGVINVRAHTRVVSHLTDEALERKVKRDRSGNIISLESRKSVAARQKEGVAGFQYVGAHQRNVDYAGKPFIAPAIEQAQPIILEQIRSELSRLSPLAPNP